MGTRSMPHGTWYLEDIVGKRKAKEILSYRNPDHRPRGASISASSTRSCRTTPEVGDAVFALESLSAAVRTRFIKDAFNARHGGVSGACADRHMTCCCCTACLETEESRTSFQSHHQDEARRPREIWDDPVRPFLTLHHPLPGSVLLRTGLVAEEYVHGLFAKHAAGTGQRRSPPGRQAPAHMV